MNPVEAVGLLGLELVGYGAGALLGKSVSTGDSPEPEEGPDPAV